MEATSIKKISKRRKILEIFPFTFLTLIGAGFGYVTILGLLCGVVSLCFVTLIVFLVTLNLNTVSDIALGSTIILGLTAITATITAGINWLVGNPLNIHFMKKGSSVFHYDWEYWEEYYKKNKQDNHIKRAAQTLGVFVALIILGIGMEIHFIYFIY